MPQEARVRDYQNIFSDQMKKFLAVQQEKERREKGGHILQRNFFVYSEYLCLLKAVLQNVGPRLI